MAAVEGARVTSVAVDLMGGDDAPDVVIAGIREAVASTADIAVVAVGPRDAIDGIEGDRLTCIEASEVIAMDEHPAQAVRSRPDASMPVACRAVKEGVADAFFTAGNTGAALASALLVLGRIKGVKRPALATVVPATDRVPILLDLGANADCTAELLVQFALMGREYASVTLGVPEPTVGLLNIGEEDSKGSKLALEAHGLMRDLVPGFYGNVEGRDIPRSPVDVIVTDGFTGNIAIKLIEGTAKTLMGEFKEAMTGSLLARLGALASRRDLVALKARLDPDEYGGAPLLGVDGVCIVGHGSSSPHAIASGISVAARAARSDLTGRIATAIG